MASSTVSAVLVVAATDLELARIEGAETFCCGIGPVEAALTTARTLAERPVDAILQIGIAGARSYAPGSLVLGSEAVYCDLIDPERLFPRIERVAPDPSLLAVARKALPEAHVVPIATSARDGGGSCCDVEAMEGFGVLRAAAHAGVPALELRSISNAVADVRENWRIEDALEALTRAVVVVLEAFDA